MGLLMATKQPDIKIPVDDIAGLLRRLIQATKTSGNKTVVGIHGSPKTGLKKIQPRIDEWGEWGDWETPAVFSQIINRETGGWHLERLNELARHYAAKKSALPDGTGSMYLGKQKIKDIEKMYSNDPDYKWTRVSEKPIKVKKELTLAGKTKEEQLKELEKFLKRQGIKIYK
jgi:hypothetical protein